MNKKKELRLRLLTYGVIAYLCFAFAWWTALLYIKNQNTFQAKVDALRIVMIEEGTYNNEKHFINSPPYQNLKANFNRQEWMIFGEAATFMLSIILGVWLINNSYFSLVKSANQKRNFLLSITHELKSPIASAKLGLETIYQRSLSEANIKKVAKGSLQEVDRLKNLVDNLLLAARVENNYEAVYESEDINKLIKNWTERIQSNFPNYTFEISLDKSENILDIDRQAIESVYINLIENAIKYGGDSKWVGISTNFLIDRWELHVSDMGPGIPENEKEQIFELFYRVGNEDTRKTKGTGLGLYIIQQMTEAHGGKVQLKDNQPNGSIFVVSLPKKHYE